MHLCHLAEPLLFVHIVTSGYIKWLCKHTGKIIITRWYIFSYETAHIWNSRQVCFSSKIILFHTKTKFPWHSLLHSLHVSTHIFGVKKQTKQQPNFTQVREYFSCLDPLNIILCIIRGSFPHPPAADSWPPSKNSTAPIKSAVLQKYTETDNTITCINITFYQLLVHIINVTRFFIG